MIKNNPIVNIKVYCTFALYIIMPVGVTFASGVHSSIIHTLIAMAEDQTTIPDTPSQFAPTPISPTWAQVSLSVNSLPSVSQTSILAIASTFRYTQTNTISAIGSNFIGSIVITCAPTPFYRIYSGSLGSTTAVVTTFTTTTPGTTCPLGTASCGTPAAITLTLTTVNVAVSVVDTNYNKTFTSTNTGLAAYVTGYYTCTYTDPNLGILVNQIIQWGQGS